MKRKKKEMKIKKESKKNKDFNNEKVSVKDKILLFIKNISYDTKNIIKDNKLLFVYVFGAVLNGIILRAFTIGNPLNLRPILADMIVTLIFASLYFLVKKKYRFI